MGVIRTDRKHNSSDLLEEMIEQFEIIAEQEIMLATAEHLQAERELTRALNEYMSLDGRKSKSQDRKQRKKASTKPEPTFRGLGCRGKSQRKHRRYENGNMLAHHLDLNLLEEELEELNIYDFSPRTKSAFAQLMAEKEAMKAWNDFINATEEEQQAILIGLSDSEDEDGWIALSGADHLRRRGRRGSRRKQRSTDSAGDVDDEARRSHPAFCPSSAFEAMDAHMKRLLKRKNLPKGVLTQLEQELVEYFSQVGPTGQPYLSRKDPLERLCLHATSQWMDLNCQSFNRKDGRWSRVAAKRINHGRPFVPPPITLANYLTQMSL